MDDSTSLKENVTQRGPLLNRPRYLLFLFSIILLSLLFTGCDGGYSSTAPAASTAKTGAESGAVTSDPLKPTIHTTDATLAYIFSENVIVYNPCKPPAEACPVTYVVGNPINSYSIDPISGMPSAIGIPGDVTPANTISTVISPSGNFQYVLAGTRILSSELTASNNIQYVLTNENFVHTFSIGYLTFTVAEFTNLNIDPLKLYNALAKAGYLTGTVLSSEQAVAKLAALLEDTALYDRIAANNPHLLQTNEIINLKTKTISIRGKPFSSLTYSEKKSIVNLNRLMVELVYPGETPKNKGVSALHAVAKPVAAPQVSSYASIVVEPLGQFAYVLGSKLGVYSIDQTNGALIARGTQTAELDTSSVPGKMIISYSTTGNQPAALGQLIIAQSGLLAYGSMNGALQTYSIDRSTGKLAELGTAFEFKGWISGRDYNNGKGYTPQPWQNAPFHNMVADPTGKFLYLIASSGTQFTPPDVGDCPPNWKSKHQLGSLVYTFIIDNTTGRLTLSGPPLDTTPHIMTFGSVDPLGRFVQLLNTHEYYGGSYTPDACSGGSTEPVKPGSIYSYYVDQSTGKLYPSGAVAVGGTEIPPAGFVYSGMDSVSLTGNTTGSFLYLLNAGDMYVYNVDQADGALNAVGSPLTGATVTGMPGKTDPPITWPSVCFTNSRWNGSCTLTDSRSHSMTWAGY